MLYGHHGSVRGSHALQEFLVMCRVFVSCTIGANQGQFECLNQQWSPDSGFSDWLFSAQEEKRKRAKNTQQGNFCFR